MAKTSQSTPPVSANNPCAFVRALVSAGRLADDTEPIGKVAEVIVETARRGAGHPVLPHAAITAVALIANGLRPATLLKTKRQGVRLNGLRGGPLDKKGVGSGILEARGRVDAEQLARLREFATPHATADASCEPGLGRPQLKRFMIANFERAARRRRLIDRALMSGEWPVLLKVLGKDGVKGRYLSLKDVETLFSKRRLPDRMNTGTSRAAWSMARLSFGVRGSTGCWRAAAITVRTAALHCRPAPRRGH